MNRAPCSPDVAQIEQVVRLGRGRQQVLECPVRAPHDLQESYPGVCFFFFCVCVCVRFPLLMGFEALDTLRYHTSPKP